jgi:hypothetical protein
LSLTQKGATDQTSQAAINYTRRGLKVVPIPTRQKGPKIPGWQNLRLTEEELPTRFANSENVGVLLGEPSGGLTDIDLDCQEAIMIAHYFLPRTGAVFGRSSKLGSHLLYICNGIEMQKFQTKPDGTIVEIRSTGGQTVFPPSIHPSGELISWVQDGEPLEVGPKELKRAVSRLAAAALLARHWPAKGSRQEAALALAGGLIREGWTEEEVKHFIEAVSIASRDEEPRMRAQAAVTTARKTGKPTTGFKTLAGLVGEETVNTIREWLGTKTAEEPWPDPEEIREDLRPVEPLPPAIIPKPLRPWLLDIAHRMQCPIDFVSAGAVVVAGAIVGAGCGIRPKQFDDWLVIPNLWGGVVARPSMLKTPSLTEIMKPLARLEIEAKEQYESDLKFFEAKEEVHKAEREALKANMVAVAKGKKDAPKMTMDALKRRFAEMEEPEPPVRRRFKTNDSTIEKLGELLNENPRGILLFRDELVGLLCSWDREDRKQDRAFYLESWNGYGSFTTDRIGRGTIDVNNCCISILGGIQPSKLTGYLRQASSDIANDGLIQRFQLLVYPDEPSKWTLVDKWPDTEAKGKAWEMLKNLSTINFLEAGAELPESEKIPFFRFSPEGQAVFNEWLTGLEAKLRTDDMPLMIEHLAKYRSLMPSLALIFHLLGIADGKPGGSVTQESAAMAAAWCEYLESHARRIYGLLGDVAIRAASELAAKIKAGKVEDGFTIRDIYNRKHWHLLDTKELVFEACQELVSAGWLKVEERPLTGGRPKEIYRINPKIFSLNA